MSANYVAERLIATVARAFYEDTIIVVVDALIREKFIRFEEMGPRLRMAQKSVQNAVNRLTEAEMLVKIESIPVPDSREIAKYCYIDYQHAVNVIRLRIHLMRENFQSQESNVIQEIYYLCPTCKRKYTGLEALKYKSADNKFICYDCCPDADLKKSISQEYFRLVEFDNKGKLSEVQLMEKKMREQLTPSADHEVLQPCIS
jgi:transcription initiation factor TFIIE subunit alpha